MLHLGRGRQRTDHLDQRNCRDAHMFEVMWIRLPWFGRQLSLLRWFVVAEHLILQGPR